MSEDARQCLTFSGPVTLSQDGVLELYAEEQGLVEVKLDDLRSRLQQLTELQVSHSFRNILRNGKQPVIVIMLFPEGGDQFCCRFCILGFHL